jgi:release factor glutamine methyltransferase
MDFYRRIAQGAERYLAPGGFLLFELSAARRAQIETVVTGHGFAVEEIIKDYAGLDRVLVARRRQE